MKIKNNDYSLVWKKKLEKKIIARFSLLFIFLMLLILVPAGTLKYWQVYVYAAILLIPMFFVVHYFLKKDPIFLERRMKFKEKEKEQKLIQSLFSLFFIAGYVVSGLDKRYGWSEIPVGVIILSDILIFIGYLMIFLVFKQNSYAARIVDVEETQKLISTGLYGIIRHPMYFGVVVMYLLTPVALGSYWGLIPMAAIPLALVLRILNEEKVLCKELAGYQEYCQKVKYRLIPFIW
jgi:protein-S-isoprenylcysteine O-methyltransferase Ste14